MAQTRLNNDLRQTIVSIMSRHAFDDRAAALKVTEAALLIQAINEALGVETRVRIADLPEGWMPERSYLYINAGGYKLTVHGESFRWPASLDYTYPIKNVDLIDDFQKWANAERTMDEERRRLKSQLRSLLVSCTTLEAFYRAMPDAEPIVRDKLNVLPPAPTNALVTVGSEIMCMIAKARQEERSGCCNGTLVTNVTEAMAVEHVAVEEVPA